MGIATSLDIFQKVLNNIFEDLDYVLVFLDDILIQSKDEDSFKDHLSRIKKVFAWLHKVGMKINLGLTQIPRVIIDTKNNQTISKDSGSNKT